MRARDELSGMPAEFWALVKLVSRELYGTTTFGSRVADGVYETALDGYELGELTALDIKVDHYLFVDAHFTWWQCGRSYLARIIDMLYVGLLDAAFFGREVLRVWPTVVERDLRTGAGLWAQLPMREQYSEGRTEYEHVFGRISVRQLAGSKVSSG